MSRFFSALAVLCLTSVFVANAQTFPTDDPVIKQMWDVGIENSRTQELAHMLMDVNGPRLAGSPGLASAQDWLIETYESWGVPARREEYGTWNGWEQGILHVDMVEPRVTSLHGELLAFSPGTNGPVTGEVAVVPGGLDETGASEWLASVEGKFVMLSAAELMCRAPQELEANARPEVIERLNAARQEAASDYRTRLQSLGGNEALGKMVEAGAAGFLTSNWSRGWGANKVFSAPSREVVGIDLSCEDYGLLFRLSESGHTPVLEVEAQTRDLGEVPQFNVIAEMRGTELPGEYVILGAHLDSWHAATGATDNGTGTITMLEAARILKETYPNPRRTILIGHWGAEEMGLIGSGAFREDNPEIMEGVQAVFNQDNGTWAFEKIEGQGFLNAAAHIPQWMNVVPTEISGHIELELPGPQANSGSDHTSFVCAGIPAFRFQSPYDEYRQYTWHTNLDTYDKIVFDDLRENATLAAMVAYMASEDPVTFDRAKANLPINSRTGQPREWPGCRSPRRSAN